MHVLKKENRKLRWKDLLKGIRKGRNMKMSTRTLSDRLKNLEESGFVRRSIDTKVYPPAVYYELTNQGHKSEFPFVMILSELQKFEMAVKEFGETTGLIKTSLEDGDPDKALQATLINYLHNLLLTLNLCLDAKPEALPFIMDYNVKSYEVNLTALVAAILNSPSFAKVVRKSYEDIKKENRATINRHEEDFCTPFKDKELSKVVVSQFAVMRSIGEVKTPVEFFKKILNDNSTLKKIEKRFGIPIPEKRLRTMLDDPAWKTLNYKSSKFS